jgi:putative ABC transport system permease protein
MQIPPLGRHPHQNQLMALIALLSVFGVLALILSAILTAALVQAMMAREIRSIGAMKAVGGATLQIASLYLALVAGVGAVAVAVGIPLGAIAGRALARTIADLLNFTINSSRIPAWVFAVQVSAGVMVPLLLSLLPIGRASGMTVRQAIESFGVSAPTASAGNNSSFMSRLAGFGRTPVLVLRNAFRRRGRLVLTLGLLAAGGAMFMGALNTNASWFRSIAASLDTRKYDFEIRLSAPQPAADLRRAFLSIPGVASVEAWGFASASRTQSGSIVITHTYPDGGHGSFSLRGVPDPTILVEFTLIEGRLLGGDDTDGILLNQMARALYPDAKVGDRISLMASGHATSRRLLGIVREIGPAYAYMAESSFERALSLPGTARSFRIAIREHTPEARSRAIGAVDRILESSGIGVSIVVPDAEFRNAVSEHIFILIFCLAAMAVLLGIVGVLGLASAMGTSVVERTREFGIMRAIGATPAAVLGIVIGEALFIGLLSLVVSLLVSLPLSYALGAVLGNMAFKIPLLLVLSPLGVWIWCVVIVAGSVIASAGPAMRASALTIRETLSYE